MKILVLAGCLLLTVTGCTYDSTPPGDDRINDAKQLLLIDANGLTAGRLVRIQYTDLLGSTTLQTSAEKIDGSGRFLYPLYLTRGTRSYSLTIIIDQNGNESFIDTGVDLTTGVGTLNSAFVSDGETKKVSLSAASFTPL